MLNTDKLLELERKKNNNNTLSDDELLELAGLEKELYSALEKCTFIFILCQNGKPSCTIVVSPSSIKSSFS